MYNVYTYTHGPGLPLHTKRHAINLTRAVMRPRGMIRGRWRREGGLKTPKLYSKRPPPPAIITLFRLFSPLHERNTPIHPHTHASTAVRRISNSGGGGVLME